MKVILDTNVFISGIFFTGPPSQILKAWREGKLKLLFSPEILEEYQRVGTALAEQFPDIELVVIHAEVVSVPTLPEPVCVDPDDDKFIALAVASSTHIIVSGDKHLLQVSGHHGVRVLKPRQFVDEHLS